MTNTLCAPVLRASRYRGRLRAGSVPASKRRWTARPCRPGPPLQLRHSHRRRLLRRRICAASAIARRKVLMATRRDWCSRADRRACRARSTLCRRGPSKSPPHGVAARSRELHAGFIAPADLHESKVRGIRVFVNRCAAYSLAPVARRIPDAPEREEVVRAGRIAAEHLTQPEVRRVLLRLAVVIDLEPWCAWPSSVEATSVSFTPSPSWSIICAAAYAPSGPRPTTPAQYRKSTRRARRRCAVDLQAALWDAIVVVPDFREALAPQRIIDLRRRGDRLAPEADEAGGIVQNLDGLVSIHTAPKEYLVGSRRPSARGSRCRCCSPDRTSARRRSGNGCI